MQDTTSPAAPAAARYTLWQLVGYMPGLGTWGFGGPVALVGYMYRDLVEKRSWITEADYKEGMAIAQLMPGPLAAQLAIYLASCTTACSARRSSAWRSCCPRS
jgi:chromate transporter